MSNTTSSRGIVEIEIGGQKRRLRVPIELAPEIEERLERGIIDITRDMLAMKCRLAEVAAILTLALAKNGMHYSESDVLKMVSDTGIIPSMTAAGRVLNEFFKTPDDDAKDKPKGKAKAPVTADSH